MTRVAALSLAILAALCGPAAAQERRPVASREFTITISTSERVGSTRLWVSRDAGRTWTLAREAGIAETWGEWAGGAIRCTVRVPEDGAYDFYPQFGDAVTNRTPDPKPGQAPHPRLQFEVREPRTVGAVEWEEPKGSPHWTGAATVTLKWHSVGDPFRERSGELQYAIAGQPWVTITKGLDASGSYRWIVPNKDTTELRLRVRALTRAGQDASAETDAIYVRAAGRADLPQARALYDRARVLLAQQRHAEALLKYEEALAAWPDFAEVLNDVGKIHSDRNDPVRALEYFIRAKKASPSHPTAYVNAAMTQARLGLYADALADLRDALAVGLEKDERTAVLAGETLWKVAVASGLSGEKDNALLACEMILRVRLASRATRAKAEQYVAANKPKE